MVVDGCPPGLELAESDIQPDLDRRRPGQSSITTPRKETDTVQIEHLNLSSSSRFFHRRNVTDT